MKRPVRFLLWLGRLGSFPGAFFDGFAAVAVWGRGYESWHENLLNMRLELELELEP